MSERRDNGTRAAIPQEAMRAKTCPTGYFGFAAHFYEAEANKPFESLYGDEAIEAERQLELHPKWRAKYQFHRAGIISRYERFQKTKEAA